MRVNLITVTLFLVLVSICEVLCAPSPENEAKTSDFGDSASCSELWKLSTSKDDIRALQSKLMKSYMNTSADPCEDFYEYACGNWKNVHPLLEGQSKNTVLLLMNAHIQNALREILLQPVSSNQELSAEEKARVYFATCLDEETVNKRGKEPLLNVIKDLGGWPVLDDNWSEEGFDWFQLAIKMASLGYQSILSSHVETDYRKPSSYAIYLEDSNYGADNQDDITRVNKEAVDHYRTFIVSVLKLLDVDAEKAKETAKEIIDFESRLAELAAKDGGNIDHSTTIESLSKKYPHIDWMAYFTAILQTPLQPDQEIITLTSPNYFDHVAQLIKETPAKTLANAMVWQTVHRLLASLDVNFQTTVDNFESSTGQQQSQKRWKACLLDVNEGMGMAVGAMFVREYFNEDSKNAAVELSKVVKEKFRENLAGLESWMDEKTKELALGRVDQMKFAVGYPDFILDPSKLNELYNDLHIAPGKNFENSVNLLKYTSRIRGERIKAKPDEDEWPITSTIVKSLEHSRNRIFAPAAVLRPPMFHKDLPQSLNYGAIGVLMGYELNYGFDERIGKKDDAGNKIQWWSPAGVDKFKKQVECFHDKYEKESIDGVRLKESMTFSENIADNGAMSLVLGIHRSKQDLSEVMPNLDLTNDQLFFLGYAQSWCGVARPEANASNKLAPGKFRVPATLSNFKEFSEAFKCPAGSAMNPEVKCQLL